MKQRMTVIELDDRESLREDAGLARLLRHYVDLSRQNRGAWHDRLMADGAMTPEALTRQHGRLLACGWLEMQVGQFTRLAPGEVAGCYRATSAGRGTLRDVDAS